MGGHPTVALYLGGLVVAGRSRRTIERRHSFGTIAAVRSGGDMKLVQDLMRHKAITTTTRYVRYHPRGHAVVNGMYGDAAGVVPAAS